MRGLRDASGRLLYVVKFDVPQEFFDYRTRRKEAHGVVGIAPRHVEVSFENGVTAGEMADVISFEEPRVDHIDQVVPKSARIERLDIVRVFPSAAVAKEYLANPLKFLAPQAFH
jgi:hypothetical protein